MKLVTTKELRDAPDTKLDKDSIVVLSLGTEVKFDQETVEESRQIDFTISTETADSYNDVVKADGWDLERYLKNPVVLWAHDRHTHPPIGKASNVRAENGSLKATAEFATKDDYEFADNVFRLLKNGFLNATSVGFLPKEWTYDEERGGFNFIKSELFEFSVVPVPANPDALMNAIDRGENLEFLKDWCEQTLDCWRPDGHVAMWVPRSSIEAIHGLVSSASWHVTNDSGDVGPVVTGNSDSKTVTFTGGQYEPTITSDPYHEFWSPNTAPREDMSSETFHVRWNYTAADDEAKQKLDALTELVQSLSEKVEMLLESHEQQPKAVATIDLEALLMELQDGLETDGQEEDKDDIVAGLRAVLDQVEESGIIENEDELRSALKEEAERAIMKRTGKLPKEV